MPFTRREFLKLCAIAAGAALIPGCRRVNEGSDENDIFKILERGKDGIENFSLFLQWLAKSFAEPILSKLNSDTQPNSDIQPVQEDKANADVDMCLLGELCAIAETNRGIVEGHPHHATQDLRYLFELLLAQFLSVDPKVFENKPVTTVALLLNLLKYYQMLPEEEREKYIQYMKRIKDTFVDFGEEGLLKGASEIEKRTAAINLILLFTDPLLLLAMETDSEELKREMSSMCFDEVLRSYEQASPWQLVGALFSGDFDDYIQECVRNRFSGFHLSDFVGEITARLDTVNQETLKLVEEGRKTYIAALVNLFGIKPEEKETVIKAFLPAEEIAQLVSEKTHTENALSQLASEQRLRDIEEIIKDGLKTALRILGVELEEVLNLSATNFFQSLQESTNATLSPELMNPNIFIEALAEGIIEMVRQANIQRRFGYITMRNLSVLPQNIFPFSYLGGVVKIWREENSFSPTDYYPVNFIRILADPNALNKITQSGRLVRVTQKGTAFNEWYLIPHGKWEDFLKWSQENNYTINSPLTLQVETDWPKGLLQRKTFVLTVPRGERCDTCDYNFVSFCWFLDSQGEVKVGAIFVDPNADNKEKGRYLFSFGPGENDYFRFSAFEITGDKKRVVIRGTPPESNSPMRFHLVNLPMGWYDPGLNRVEDLTRGITFQLLCNNNLPFTILANSLNREEWEGFFFPKRYALWDPTGKDSRPDRLNLFFVTSKGNYYLIASTYGYFPAPMPIKSSQDNLVVLGHFPDPLPPSISSWPETLSMTARIIRQLKAGNGFWLVADKKAGYVIPIPEGFLDKNRGALLVAAVEIITAALGLGPGVAGKIMRELAKKGLDPTIVLYLLFFEAIVKAHEVH